MKKNIKLFLVMLLSASSISYAQDKPKIYMSADLTSAYLWRGQKNAGVSIQPVIGMKWKNLNFYFWGNEQIAPPSGQPVKHEIDLFLKYNITKNLTFGIKDVYVNTRGTGVFSFGTIPHASNGLDVLLAYDFKYLNVEWSTTIAGYDGYTKSGHRAYGSYLVINAPFHFAKVDWNAQVGIVPYYCSRYSDDISGGFHVNACALRAAHTFNFTKISSSLTPYMQLMVNPSSRRAYFQVGGKFSFEP